MALTSILRHGLSHARDWFEGLFFRIACAWLGIPSDCPRFPRLAKTGLRDWRQGWWTLFQLERWRDLLRYALLIEACDAHPEGRADGTRNRVPEDARNILVISLGHFGDMLHLVPLLKEIKQTRPDIVLDVLVGPWGKDMISRVPYVDNVLVYAPHVYHYHRGNTSACLSFKDERRWVCALRERNYDAVMLTSITPHYVELLLLSAAAPRSWIGPEPTCDLYKDLGCRVDAPYERGLYEAERLLRLSRFFGNEPAGARLEFWPREEEEISAVAMLAEAGIETGDPYAIICPGAGWPGKKWPEKRLAELGDRLVSERDMGVLLVGSPGEFALCESVQNAMTKPAANLAGRTSWGSLAALIRGAQLFVGNDSGPMHLAAVYETPSVVFFGPTPPAHWAPRHATARTLRAVDSCPDCMPWHPGKDCVHGRSCMRKIEVSDAWNAVGDVLDAQKEHSMVAR